MILEQFHQYYCKYIGTGGAFKTDKPPELLLAVPHTIPYYQYQMIVLHNSNKMKMECRHNTYLSPSDIF